MSIVGLSRNGISRRSALKLIGSRKVLMTVGNINNDHRVLVQPTFNGTNSGSPVLAGRKSTKVWNGVDSPPLIDPPVKEFIWATTVDSVTGRRRRFRRVKTRLKRERKFTTFNPYTVTGDNIDFPASTWTDHSVYDTGGMLVSRNWANVPASTPSWGLSLPVVPPLTVDHDYQLIGRLVDELRGSDFNLAVMLGEGSESLRMIGDAAVKLARAGRFVRKGNLVSAAATLGVNRLQKRKPTGRGVVADRWLELQYGWLPLLNDIKGAAEMLSHLLHVPMRKRYVARVQTRFKNGNLNPANGLLYYSSFVGYNRKQIVADIAEAPNPVTLTGLLDPELVAWELLPFSFVVDWFVPIGTYLENRAAAQKLQGKFATTTSTFRLGQGVVGRKTSGYQGPNRYTRQLICTGVQPYNCQYTVNRTVASQLNVPFPKVKTLDKALSWQHCLNGIALLPSVFGKAFSKAHAD